MILVFRCFYGLTITMEEGYILTLNIKGNCPLGAICLSTTILRHIPVSPSTHSQARTHCCSRKRSRVMLPQGPILG